MTVDQFIVNHPDHPMSDLLRGMYLPESENFLNTKFAVQGMIILLHHQETFPELELAELMIEIKEWEYTRAHTPKPTEIN